LAYKANTNSIKNSPAISLLEDLGPTDITVYDPQITLDKGCFPNVRQASSAMDAAKDTDALVVTTPWAEFSGIDLASVKETMRGNVIIDPFGALDRIASNGLGFAHHRLGSPSNSRPAAV
jgi:UDPglucose 6-dehydrogenase